MSKLKIVLYPNKILETPTVPVTEFNAELEQLVKDMLTTMHAAKGIGLAAPQVGILKQIMVWGGDPQSGVEEGHIINPELWLSANEGMVYFEEGCLSFPKLTATVKRCKVVRITGVDFAGNPKRVDATGLLAIVLQHEYDHLQGRTFMHYLSKLKRDIIKKKMEKFGKKVTAEQFKELMLEEILRRKALENNSPGPGGDASLQRSEPDPTPAP